MALDIHSIRQQFPILESELVYLDSAATTQKPECVLQAMDEFYCTHNANVHRGIYALGEHATNAYEHARSTVQTFVNAKLPAEIVFTKSCTESLNLIAKSWGKAHLQKGDTVVLSILEHHSNIVPWLQLQEDISITVEWIDCDEEGNLNLHQLDDYLATGNVKLVSITGQSNVLGVKSLLQEVITKAHAHGSKVCVDAAQLAAHSPIDVQELDIDFLTFSGHKVYGPTGIGVLYAKREHLENMPPFLGGGNMITEVHTDSFTPAEIPHKFEAGTPPIAEAVGLSSALEWLHNFSWEDREAHEVELMEYAHAELSKLQDITILGPKDSSLAHGCMSFTHNSIHAHDLAELLSKKNIALRAGHHCTQPLHDKLGVTASMRMSIGLYTNKEDITKLITALTEITL